MKILLIDNYDSFTFNLYHYLSSLNAKVDVVRNDKINSKEIIRKKGATNRIHIYIYPPAEHMEIIKAAVKDDKIKNKRALGLYLAELKKRGLAPPPGCTKDSFGTFYTKATSLSGKDKELFEAFSEANENENPPTSDEESEEEL